ncbi:MAG: hypothetical protein PVF33_12450 [Candidatus Latescibacterota bacterium]|jgi:hypothetical protein
MRFVLNRSLASVVLLAFICYVLPVNVFAGNDLKPGKKSADEAATLHSQDPAPADSTPPLRYAVPLSGGYSEPDSTEFDFPEEEGKHLYRDIAVFTIISVFVAYFVIKVFLEGDTEDNTQDDGGGKQPPPI